MHVDLGEILSLWSTLPFVGMLLSIALFPLFAPHFWHDHFGKISVFWILVIKRVAFLKWDCVQALNCRRSPTFISLNSSFVIMIKIIFVV